MQIRFGDDVRRVFITTDGIDFAKLSALLRSKFQCQDDVLIIKYVDDESDLVTITDGGRTLHEHSSDRYGGSNTLE